MRGTGGSVEWGNDAEMVTIQVSNRVRGPQSKKAAAIVQKIQGACAVWWHLRHDGTCKLGAVGELHRQGEAPGRGGSCRVVEDGLGSKDHGQDLAFGQEDCPSAFLGHGKEIAVAVEEIFRRLRAEMARGVRLQVKEAREVLPAGDQNLGANPKCASPGPVGLAWRRHECTEGAPAR